MLKILKERWAAKEHILRDEIAKIKDVNSVNYERLVELTFSVIYDELATEAITKIDDGDYQGTLLFVIPFRGYQPGPGDYLMTYVDYGSCGGCDILEAIKDYHLAREHSPDEDQIDDLLKLCRDIVMNTIKPYNFGWRHSEEFDHVEFEEG